MQKTIIFLWILILLISCKETSTNKFRSDLNNSGVYNSVPIKTIPKELWTFKTNGEIHASVAYDDKNIFIGSGDKNIYSIDAKTGICNWKFETNGAIYSTASIEGKFIYFLSTDGYLYKLNKNNGKLIWKFVTTGEKAHKVKDYFNLNQFVVDFWDFYQSSPIISDNKIYVGSGNTFYCIHKKTGKKIWEYLGSGAIHTSAAIKNNKVYFGSFDSKVYCLDANTGNEIWDYQTGKDTTYYCWLGIQGSPAIENDKLYIGSRDGLVYCLNSTTGDSIWTNKNFERSWMPSSFAIGEKLYCGSSDAFSFYAINKSTGNIEYKIKTNSYTFSSPAIDSEMAYIGSANGRLYGINLDTKSIIWEYNTTKNALDSINVFDEYGIINIKNYNELGIKMQVNNFDNYVSFSNLLFKTYGAILSSPVINNNTIYFGDYNGIIYALSN
ncbi:MAG: hypothetical protein A2041_11565 [Bacteroidetes bacterium GWA2_31_9b]|nr:MAG: hypothetical protein A2041_11565 [Bacteroidetes bacterium GWA2_31_9b]